MKTLIALTLLALTCNLNAEFPDTPTSNDIINLYSKGRITSIPGIAPHNVMLFVAASDSLKERVYGTLKSEIIKHPDFQPAVQDQPYFSVFVMLKKQEITSTSYYYFGAITLTASYDIKQRHNSEYILTMTTAFIESEFESTLKEEMSVLMKAMKEHKWYVRTPSTPEEKKE